MNKQSLFYLLLICITFTACKKDADDNIGYLINGKALNVKNGKKIYLHKIENFKPVIVDSTVVNNEQFEFKGNVLKPDLRFITTEGQKRPLYFILSNSHLKAAMQKDSFNLWKVTGDDENKVFNEFNALPLIK